MKIQLYLSLLIAAFLLTGCATVSANKLGIPTSEWAQYSPAKKDQMILAYDQTQRSKKNMVAKPGKGVLSVHIKGGQALLPPYTQLVDYQPLIFNLHQGDCHKKIEVFQSNGSNKSGSLEVCYKDDILYLDPSSYNPTFALGTLQFPYIPVWTRGFTYPPINSTGLLKLHNVEITLQQLVASDDTDTD